MSFSTSSAAGSPPWRNHSFILRGRDPPLSDQGETIIGAYLLLLGWLSWFGNSIVLFILYRQRSSLLPTDYLTFNLAVSDASISVFGYSRGIIEIFNIFQGSDYIISSIWTCQVDGFFTLVFGLSSINTLTVISITRYIKGCHPSRGPSPDPKNYSRHISRASVSVCLLLIWITAGFWSGAPLLGWGSYTDRGYGTCEIDWAKANYSSVYRSYIISILIFCFFIPVLIMLFCYVSIINTVKRGNALSAEGDLTDRQRKLERDVTIVSIVICTAFILAWSPYAVVSMWSACGFHVPNLTSIFTRLFAKSASFYNPLIYFGLSSKFRKDVAILLPCARDAKDTVRLKRFKPKADAHGRLAVGGGTRLKVPLIRAEKKYSPDNQPNPAPSLDRGIGSPPGTPLPPNKEVFYINVPYETGSDFEYHEAPGSSELADPRKALRRRRRKRGKRGGLHARVKARASRPPLPSLLLANVRSLENKLRTDFHRDLALKTKSQRTPFSYRLTLFTEAIERPPNSTAALSKLHDVISALETAHPDAVFIVAGDFNQCSLRTVFPKYHQHVDIPTRDKNTLDHVYSNIPGAYRAAPRPHFGHSDHISLFLYPAYRQRLKQTHPVTKRVKLWTPETENTLQDCFALTDWDVFKAAATLEDSSVSVQDYAEYVTGYISTCVDNIVPTIQIRKFPNQKPWINSQVRQMLRTRSLAIRSSNETEYKAARYGLRKAITAAKRQYREKLDSFYSTTDSGRMWQGLQHITDYRTNTTHVTTSTDSLPDDLNTIYTRFEGPSYTAERGPTHTWTTQPPSPPSTVSTTQVHKALRKINPRKAAGPDNIPGRALRACANELADVLTSIFKLSLSQCTVPLCFKTTTIVPLPKKSPPTCLNDYRPVALTPIIMKCFERVVLAHIQSSIPDTIDPLQYAYRPNRSTSDAIAAAIHYSLSHLENKDSYLRILFIDYSSAFNTVILHKLTHKLSTLGLHPTLCDWLLDFLTGRPQSVRIGNRTSARLITNIGTPQGCVLSPILYTLFTYDCVASHKDNIILKFADDTAVIGRIAGGDEAAYRREVASLVS
ncbi:hypothetical protein Q8A73_002729 [Channa argus]|nr:hypothetical protein Q8A73_002729 [Channa argus]